MASRSGAVPVVDSGQLIGIFSERDLLRRVVGQGRDPAKVQLRDVMTPDPVTVRLGTRMTDAVELIAARKISELPVVDTEGKPVGLI
ncbi:MAG: CBS domain-containing protein, partial [Planctomycetota bacterium]